MDITFHYPPELMNLLIQTIPLLFKSKRDVILFFRGAGVSTEVTGDLQEKINTARETINKYEITRTILERLNANGEKTLRERREILKRITEFENYSGCWPDDVMAAKGYVAEIRQIVNVKDSFTKMKIERDLERQRHQAEQQAKIEQIRRRQDELESIRKDLYSLFGEKNSQKRGKALEGVLNHLFKFYGISIREAFELTGNERGGIVEQIDGVIEIDGTIYLVEMKWWQQPLGVDVVTQHISRVFLRAGVGGIFISASGYTEPAVKTCQEALQQKVIILCDLNEFVKLLEKEADLKELIKNKINEAKIAKNPFYTPLD